MEVDLDKPSGNLNGDFDVGLYLSCDSFLRFENHFPVRVIVKFTILNGNDARDNECTDGKIYIFVVGQIKYE